MGTRGIMGLRVGEKDFLQYVQFDSYPDGWPSDLVKYLREIKKDSPEDLTFRTRAAALKAVSEDTAPSVDEQQALRGFADLQVSTQKLDEWYVLLRKCQGDLPMTLLSGYILNNDKFIFNSLFCEYAYIVNLDTNRFEVYAGFQHDPHDKGRYASPPDGPEKAGTSTYWGCALVKEFDLYDIPEDWDKQAFPPEEEDEE